MPSIHTLRQSVFFVLLLLLAAAANAQEFPAHSSLSGEQRSDIALRHFVLGNALEFEGDAGGAVEAYRGALLYDDDPAIHVRLATLQLGLRHPAEAALHARAALEFRPDDIKVQRLLGEIYLSGYNADSGRIVFEHILAKDSSDTQALQILGRLYENAYPAKAKIVFERFLQQHGANPDVSMRLARLYEKSGEGRKAISTLEDLRLLEPENEAVLQTLGGLYARTGQFGESAAIYDSLLLRFPNNVSYALILAETRMNMGDWKGASQLFFPLLGNSDIDMEDQMQIGKIYFHVLLRNRSIVMESIQVFSKLKNLYPDDWRPNWYLGATWFNEGNMAQAIPELKRVSEASLRQFQALDMLSRAQLSTEDYSGAITSLETIIDADKATSETWWFLGYAHDRLGNRDKAITAYQRSLALEPGRMDALTSLALLHDAEENFDKSDALYENALAYFAEEGRAKNDTYYQLLNNYAYTLSVRGIELERALNMSREATESQENNSSYLDTMGWIYYKMKDYDNARSYISKAIDARLAQNQPPGAVLYEHLGDIDIVLGDRASALKNWELSLQADPENQEVKQKLDRHRREND